MESVPAGCLGVDYYINDQQIRSANTAISYTVKQAGTCDVSAAYYDLFGEGAKSITLHVYVKDKVDQQFLADNTVALKNVDQDIKTAIGNANAAIPQIANANAEISGIKTTLTGLQSTVAQNKSDQDKTVTQVTQNASQISLIASQLATVQGKTENNYSAIVQNANDIALRVKKDDIIGQINATAETATIDFKYLNITGSTLFQKDLTISDTVSGGLVGGAVRIDKRGMTVQNGNGTSVVFDKNGMSFVDTAGVAFNTVGRFCTGTASDGQTVTFAKPWDVIPSVFIFPADGQSCAAAYDKQNVRQIMKAINITKAGFQVQCQSVLGSGSTANLDKSTITNVSASEWFANYSAYTTTQMTATEITNWKKTQLAHTESKTYDITLPNTPAFDIAKLTFQGMIRNGGYLDIKVGLKIATKAGVTLFEDVNFLTLPYNRISQYSPWVKMPASPGQTLTITVTVSFLDTDEFEKRTTNNAAVYSGTVLMIDSLQVITNKDRVLSANTCAFIATDPNSVNYSIQ